MQNPADQPHYRGSAYSVLVVALCACFLLYKYVMQVSPGVMAQDIMQAFNMTGTDLGHMGAVFFYSYVFMQLFVGVLIDRYGTRLLATFAILVSALGTYLFAKSNILFHAELSRALMGAGVAFATVAYMKMAAVWFPPRQFAFIAGLAATAAMVGAIAGQTPLLMLVKNFGWREALVICSGIGVALAILFFLIVRNNPKDYKLTQVEKKETSSILKELKAVLGNSQNWLLTLYNSLMFAPLALFAGLWGNLFLVTGQEATRNEASFLVSFAFAGLAFGAPIIGFLSNRFGRRRQILFASPLLACIAMCLVVYVQMPNHLVALALFLFGFFTGGFILCFAIARDLNHAALAATVAALINTGDAISSALSETLVGWFLDKSWDGVMVDGVRQFSVVNFRLAFLLIPACLIGSALLVYFIKDVKVSQKR